jgi:hypothetical protein
MKKTNRQNKTGLTVNWPTGFYTMETCDSHPNVPSIWNQNQHFILITLRVRLTNALEDKQVVKLGTLKGSKGRPKLVFATVPVSQKTIDDARNAGVFLDDNIPHVMNVVDVKTMDDDMTGNTETTVYTDTNVPQTV